MKVDVGQSVWGRLITPLLIAVSLPIGGGARAEALPLIDGVRSERILSKATIDGRVASVWTISSSTPPKTLAEAIFSSWQLHSPGRVILEEQSGWLIVSRLYSGRLESLQLRQQGAAALGYFTRWEREAGNSSPDARLTALLPDSVRIANWHATTEKHAKNVSIVGHTHETVDAVEHALSSRAVRFGLRKLPHDPALTELRADSAPPSGAQRSTDRRSLRFVGNGRELSVAIEKHGPLSVLVGHWLETSP